MNLLGRDICPRDQRLGGGAYCFVLCHSVIVCHSVLLFETLTLLITFEQCVLELWYFTWVFLVTRPFRGYHYFLPCDLDPGVWDIFENVNLANNFWSVSARACDKIFSWYQDTLCICPCDIGHLWNWQLSRAFVFQKHILLHYLL